MGGIRGFPPRGTSVTFRQATSDAANHFLALPGLVVAVFFSHAAHLGWRLEKKSRLNWGTSLSHGSAIHLLSTEID